jgi:SET family sugar efflux transporter-like MFS transporter
MVGKGFPLDTVGGEDHGVTVVARAGIRWRSMLPLASVSLVTGTVGAFVLPFLSLFLTNEIGVNSLELGAFLLVSSVAGLVVSTLVGRLSDQRAVRRNLMVIGGLAGAVGYGFAVLRLYWVLLVVACTLVALSTSLISQLFAYARQFAERQSVTRAPLIVSSMRTIMSLSWVGGPPLAALLLQLGGYTGLYWTACGFFVAIALLSSRLPELGVPEKSAADDGPGSPRAPRMLFAIIAFVLLQGSISLSVSAIPLYVTNDLHGAPEDAGLVLGVCAALEIPLMLWFGVLAVKADLNRLVMLGALVALGYQGAMLATDSTWQVAVAQVLNAVVISAIAGVGISYFQSLAPGRPGYATTWFTNTMTVGAMLSGPLLGLSKQLGYHYAYLMALVMSALGLGFLAVAKGRTSAG